MLFQPHRPSYFKLILFTSNYFLYISNFLNSDSDAQHCGVAVSSAAHCYCLKWAVRVGSAALAKPIPLCFTDPYKMTKLPLACIDSVEVTTFSFLVIQFSGEDPGRLCQRKVVVNRALLLAPQTSACVTPRKRNTKKVLMICRF